MLGRLKGLLGRERDRGFTLIELLIVVLIVGILAAVATPLYLGYVKDSKTAEGKAVAGSLWTALQSDAISNCGTDVDVSTSFPKAGLPGGATADGRWSVVDRGSLRVDCSAGTYSAASDIFSLRGVGSDIDFITIYMTYNTGNTPPSQLECDTGGGRVKC